MAEANVSRGHAHNRTISHSHTVTQTHSQSRIYSHTLQSVRQSMTESHSHTLTTTHSNQSHTHAARIQIIHAVTFGHIFSHTFKLVSDTHQESRS